MCSTTLKTLEELFVKGNQNKSSRISADRARIVVVEGLAEYKQYERAIITEAKIKVYFCTTLTSWRKLLAEAKASERPVVAAMAVGETIVCGKITASESESIDNNGSVNNAFDVMCHKVGMTAIKELRNLHTEELSLYEEENL